MAKKYDIHISGNWGDEHSDVLTFVWKGSNGSLPRCVRTSLSGKGCGGAHVSRGLEAGKVPIMKSLWREKRVSNLRHILPTGVLKALLHLLQDFAQFSPSQRDVPATLLHLAHSAHPRTTNPVYPALSTSHSTWHLLTYCVIRLLTYCVIRLLLCWAEGHGNMQFLWVLLTNILHMPGTVADIQ